MDNEKGLTLVELLAVIVILAIIGMIAFVSVSQIINNAKFDAHLTNARNVLDVGKLAYITGEPLKNDFHNNGKNNSYTLQNLSDMGYLQDAIKSPTNFSWWEDKNDMYDMKKSLVIVYEKENPIVYKVNLNIGGGNFIFCGPTGIEEITRENLSREINTQKGKVC